MTILDIAKELDNKKKIKHEAASAADVQSFDWRPTKCEEFIVPEFNIPEVRSKKCTKEKLSKVLAFIDLYKHKRFSEGCTIIPIACTNKKLLSICGSEKNVSNLIKYMITIGLLSIENATYQFNGYTDEHNHSKTYRYYYDNEIEILEYCINNNINKYIVSNINNNRYIDTIVEKFAVSSFDASQVRFSSKLHLLKPDNYTVADFEKYLTTHLYKNYPQLAHYQQLADEINYKYYQDDVRLSVDFRFDRSFTWSKGNKAVTKIGIRATNDFVSAKKIKDTDSNFKGYYKEDILGMFELNLQKDVKSSVPRITYLLNQGVWLDEDIDLYELIYNEYLCLKGIADLPFAETREAIKALFMRAYFDKPSVVGLHTRLVMANVESKEEVDAEMRLFQQAVFNVIGHGYDSEIFFHESCIYLDVLKELLDRGYFVWQQYDCWYAKTKKNVTQEKFEQIVKEIVERKAMEYVADNKYKS